MDRIITEECPRVIVTTDIGGTDFDDFQSMVHLLVYAEAFDIEGLISSPMGSQGRKAKILEVIRHYETDYPKLTTYSDRYPTPKYLRSVTKQGAIESAVGDGFSRPTEGSAWIIQCAKRDDPRPLWVLVWGGLEDLAQALHDDPAIEKKLRVYFIGGPNKKWSTAAYNYIETHHRDLWIIENNSSYRGWFVGGDQRGDLENTSFVQEHVKGRGVLGNFFTRIQGTIKMGDTPSVAYLLGKDPEDPSKGNWGGRFVRAWSRPKYVFERDTTAEDIVETFSLVEMVYHYPARTPAGTKASLIVDNQSFPGWADQNGAWHFHFSPKEDKRWFYMVDSNWPVLNGKSGQFTSASPAPELARQPSAAHPNWWTDDPDLRWCEGAHQGAKTVSQYREAFLRDFAARLQRCAAKKE